MKLRNFRLDDARWAAFQDWCKERGTTASAVIVKVVDLCLAGYEVPEAPDPATAQGVIDEILARLDAIEGKPAA